MSECLSGLQEEVDILKCFYSKRKKALRWNFVKKSFKPFQDKKKKLIEFSKFFFVLVNKKKHFVKAFLEKLKLLKKFLKLFKAFLFSHWILWSIELIQTKT